MNAARSSSTGGSKPAGERGADKTFMELLTDPHFVFTILSLCLSLSVFFYYLWQLLFAKDDVTDKEEMMRQMREDKKVDQARLKAARARLDQQIAIAAGRVEARAKARDASEVSDKPDTNTGKKAAAAGAAAGEMEIETPAKPKPAAAGTDGDAVNKSPAKANGQQLRKRKVAKAPKDE